eukprot:5973383-Pyramimonas_sp.AAC.1
MIFSSKNAHLGAQKVTGSDTRSLPESTALCPRGSQMSYFGCTRDLKGGGLRYRFGAAPASIWSRPPYPSPLGPRFGASVTKSSRKAGSPHNA